MSDYIENQDYSMQLAAPEDDPFAYDWTKLREEVDEPLSALFADITPASLEEPIDVDANDWSGLNDALENGPWREVFHWSTEYQDAGAQPGDRAPVRLPYNMISQENTMDHDNSVEAVPRFICSHPQCSKTYKRKGDLTRHQKSHESRREFLCTAQACTYSFTRADKLRDHVRTGHDRDVLFSCPEPKCQALLTKDVLSVHGGFQSIYNRLNSHRQCPVPRCGFYVHSWDLFDRQEHLLGTHDFKGRERFASLIADRGYDYETAQIVCPVCPNRTLFSTHRMFKEHFADNHSGNYQSSELHEHRRTILSLDPSFTFYSVWNDIQDCPHEA